MKTKILLALALTSTWAGAGGTRNDKPEPIFFCQETNRSDGFRKLIVSDDQFSKKAALYRIAAVMERFPSKSFESRE